MLDKRERKKRKTFEKIAEIFNQIQTTRKSCKSSLSLMRISISFSYSNSSLLFVRLHTLANTLIVDKRAKKIHRNLALKHTRITRDTYYYKFNVTFGDIFKYDVTQYLIIRLPSILTHMRTHTHTQNKNIILA